MCNRPKARIAEPRLARFPARARAWPGAGNPGRVSRMAVSR
jgi:hypothetical protein